METKTEYFIWLILMPHIVFCEVSYNRNNESELIDHILRGYNRQARPVRDPAKPVNVSIGVNIAKMLDLDERSEILVTYLWLNVLWVDELLQWNETEFGGIKSVTLLPTQVWLPDFGMTNSAEKIYFEDHMKYFRISLQSDGRIQWHPGGIYRTACPLVVTYFPFDTQVCTLNTQNWEYESDEQVLRVGSDGVIPDSYFKENGEWRLTNTTSCEGHWTDNDTGTTFVFLKFYMKFERKAQYSIINVIIPIVLLSVMDLLVFWLPPESGEKVSLGITVLLSFSVFLLVVDERMPRTSDTIPLLTIYLSSVMATTGLSVFLTVVILHLHHKTYARSVPAWLRRVLFLRRRNHPNQRAKYTNGTQQLSINAINDNGTLEQHAKTEEAKNESIEKKPCAECSDREKAEDLDKEWKEAIRMVDHGCFFVFLFIFLMLLLIMVYPYDTSVSLESGECRP